MYMNFRYLTTEWNSKNKSGIRKERNFNEDNVLCFNLSEKNIVSI
jgi:hypothetical protein